LKGEDFFWLEAETSRCAQISHGGEESKKTWECKKVWGGARRAENEEDAGYLKRGGGDAEGGEEIYKRIFCGAFVGAARGLDLIKKGGI